MCVAGMGWLGWDGWDGVKFVIYSVGVNSFLKRVPLSLLRRSLIGVIGSNNTGGVSFAKPFKVFY